MKFIFAVTTQAPWPAFANEVPMRDRLMSYAQLRDSKLDVEEFLNLHVSMAKYGAARGR